MSPEQEARQVHWDGDAELRAICGASMVSRDDFVRRGAAIPSLEAFFGDVTLLSNLTCWFAGLQELTVVSQPGVTSLEGLSVCPDLRSLTVCECALRSTRGVNKNTRLTRLVLYSNRIGDLQDVASLGALQVLDLNHNCLGDMGKVPPLRSLSTLRLRGNGIRHLHRVQVVQESVSASEESSAAREVRLPLRCLSSLSGLSSLELSGNKILDIGEVAFLQPLTQLSVLDLAGKDTPPNPVCNAPDYLQAVLVMLPQLQQLDGFPVDGKKVRGWQHEMAVRLRAHAEMQRQRLLVDSTAAAAAAWQARQKAASPIVACLRPLRTEVAALKAALACSKSEESPERAGLEAKLAACQRFVDETSAKEIDPLLRHLPLPEDAFLRRFQPHASLVGLALAGAGCVSVGPRDALVDLLPCDSHRRMARVPHCTAARSASPDHPPRLWLCARWSEERPIRPGMARWETCSSGASSPGAESCLCG